MHDRIISPTGEVCAIKTCLTPPHFIEMHVPSQKLSGHVFVYVVIKKAIILNFRHNIFNIHDTEKLSCHMLKRADGLDHHPNMRQYTSK
jgi:hypothetical protein